MSVVNEVHLMNLRVKKFCNDGSPVNAPDAISPMQPSLSTRFGSGPFKPQYAEGVHGAVNVKALGDGTSPAFLTPGTPVGAYFDGASGPIRIWGSAWQQEATNQVGVGVWFYAIPITWPNIKASGGTSGGEFGHFYFGLNGADEAVGKEPSLELSLVDSTGQVFGTSHTFQPPTVVGDVQKISRVSLQTADFFSGWPGTDGLDLTNEILGLRVKLTAWGALENPWTAILGSGSVNFSYVPSAKQEAGW